MRLFCPANAGDNTNEARPERSGGNGGIMSMEEIVWRPDKKIIREATLTAFMEALGVPDYETLQARADTELEWFNDALLKFIDYRFVEPYSAVVDQSDGPEHVRWCIDGTTNVAINACDKWMGTPTETKPAIAWSGEDGSTRTWIYGDLHRETAKLAGALLKLGIGPGDVVAMYMPNIPEATAALLAVAKIGAIVMPLFSGFGADAIVTRLTDSGAIAVLTVDGAPRRGKVAGAKSVIDEAAKSVPHLKHVIVKRHVAADHDWVEGRDHWWEALTAAEDGTTPTRAMPADDPFLLVFTSGTTGKPKGVIHSHCGFPVKTVLDMSICMDLKHDDRILWMSDMGWLVGPIMVFGAFVVGATVVLVEGAPNYPEDDRMWRIVDEQQVTYLGLAPTIARSFMAAGRDVLEGKDFSSLRAFVSTGEAWNPDSWNWVFERVGKSKLPILNYSGGTEMGGLVSSTVIHPMKPCSFAGRVPGTGADVVDMEGNAVPAGTVGELVMRVPTIGLTRGLWQDEERYLDTYWRPIPGMWLHGDFAHRDADGFWFIQGRSDDTLKIAGKRTGPAEIESLLLGTGLLKEAAAIGAPDPIKGTAIVCVCVPTDGAGGAGGLAAIADALTAAVVTGLGAPFRPKEIVFTDDLPKTRNMKVMRRIVRAVYLGKDTGDTSSLVNPEAVEALRQKMSAAAG